MKLEMSKAAVQHNKFYSGIPEAVLDGLYRYVEDRVSPGPFLRAVLSNQLTEAIVLADASSEQNLKALVLFIRNHIPTGCHGSETKFQAWLRP
jgi:hypothetical protein